MKLTTVYSKLASLCATERTRFAIECVRLNRADDGLLVYATDGRRAIRMRIDDSRETGRRLGFEAAIPSDLWYMLCDQSATIDEFASTPDILSVKIGDRRMTIEMDKNAKFPDIDAVVTPNERRTMTTLPWVCPSYLRSIADLLDGFVADQKFRGQMSFEGDGCPVFFHAESIVGPSTTIDVAIMGMQPPSGDK